MNFKDFLQSHITDNKYIIDLKEYLFKITQRDLVDLLQFVNENLHISYVLFKPEHYQENFSFSQQKHDIEQQVEKNNRKLKKFTDDKTLCLINKIAFNWYENSYPGSFNSEIKQEWKRLEDKGWQMEQNFEQSQKIAILFMNHKLKQAVLCFQGINIEIEHFLDEDLRNQAIVDSMLDSVMAINILNETVGLVGNYFLSFTGYSYGALYAEQSVLLSRKLKPELINIQAITFDSPGSLELMAYVCRDFNLSTTLNDLKSLNIVTYLSSPNFVNSFGTHVGQIKYLYKNKDDLEKIDKEIKREDLLDYYFRSIGSLLGNGLNEILYNFNDEYSVAYLTDQNSSIRIKENHKKEFSDLTKKIIQNQPKHSYIFLTLIINTLDNIKNFPITDFDVSNYKCFKVCNQFEEVFCSENIDSIDSSLKELREKDLHELSKKSEPEFKSLLNQMNWIQLAYKIEKKNNETVIVSMIDGLTIVEIKRTYEHLLIIEQYLNLKKYASKPGYSNIKTESSNAQTQRIKEMIKDAIKLRDEILFWRNENDIKRKFKTDEIINACYQNQEDISECFQRLKFTSSSPIDSETEDESEDEFIYSKIKPDKYKEKDFSDYSVILKREKIDYKQGELGNCWLIAAFNTMKPNYHRIKHIIKKIKDDKNYVICSFIRGRPEEIKVDACFPVNEKGELVYASCDNQIYACLLERAFASANGSYEALEGGFMSEAYESLTGKPTETYCLSQFKNSSDFEDFWAKLVSYHSKKYPMGCDISVERDENYKEKYKLYGLHAYSIIQVKEIGQKKLLQIKNPHGRPTWKGDWSGFSAKWSPEYLKKIALDKRTIEEDYNNGLFWMEYDDLKKHFQKVTICIDNEELKEKRILSLNSNKCFKLTVEKKDFFYIRAYCDIPMNVPQDSDLSVVLVRKTTHTQENHNLNELDFEIVKAIRFKNIHISGFNCFLNPGIYFISLITLKSIFENRVESKIYNLIVHSKQSLQLHETADLLNELIYKMLCYLYSGIELERFMGGIPVINPTIKQSLIYKCFRRFPLLDHKHAYILTTNLKADALIISVHNNSQKRCVKFKLNVRPQSYPLKAKSKKNPRKFQKFEVVEKLTVHKIKNNAGNRNENLPLEFVNEKFLTIEHTMRPTIHTKVIAIVHRYIESPGSVFAKHCANNSIDVNDFEIEDNLDFKKKFKIELENKEMITDYQYWKGNQF